MCVLRELRNRDIYSLNRIIDLVKFLNGITEIKHRFIKQFIIPSTETLVIGTFNPESIENTADFFYGMPRIFLGVLNPRAFNKDTVNPN